MSEMYTNVLYISFLEPYTGRIVYAKPHVEYNEIDPILILPNGDIRYFETVMFALRKNKKLSLVLEVGGPCCHLLVNIREKLGLNIFHLPKARQKLPENALATLYTNGNLMVREMP